MLTVNVAPQVNLALERPVLTDVASERLESGVFATVCDEVRRLTERLAALTTCVWLLAFVKHQQHAKYLHLARCILREARKDT